MKLSYRGIAYQSSSFAIPTIATEVQACFRGQVYQVRKPAINLTSQTHTGITYRTVSKSCFKGTFMGRAYPLCPTFLLPIDAII